MTLIAESGDDELVFAHTPRYEASLFSADVLPELVEECLRGHHCAVPTGETCEWLLARLQLLGRAAVDRSHYLMAQTWFECAFAAVRGTSDLLSSVNMRMRLGQWPLAKELYARVLVQPAKLSEAQHKMADKKLEEVSTLLVAGARPPQCTPEDESSQLLASAAVTAAALLEPERLRMLQLLRFCGHEANTAHDYAAAANWFDCAFALSGGVTDLLSAANMRQKLVPASPVAEVLYEDALARKSLSDKEREVATRRLSALTAGKAPAHMSYELM